MDEIRIEWSEGLAFTGYRDGHETSIDGDSETGPSPVALLMESVAACAAIDVVVILEKGRQPFTGLAVTTRAERAESPPRYVRRLQFDFTIEGDVEEAKARRAVMLSFEKYCSVFHSLRKDIELEWSMRLEPGA
ncbi:MAG: OsmC family protein [Gemmatimonadetes bacterium]|nr:OsmC family protein [Gemmatimonadota bacterium]